MGVWLFLFGCFSFLAHVFSFFCKHIFQFEYFVFVCLSLCFISTFMVGTFLACLLSFLLPFFSCLADQEFGALAPLGAKVLGASWTILKTFPGFFSGSADQGFGAGASAALRVRVFGVLLFCLLACLLRFGAWRIRGSGCSAARVLVHLLACFLASLLACFGA